MQLVINEKNIILTQHGDEQDVSGKYPESIKIFWVSDTEKYENGQEFLPGQAATEAHNKKHGITATGIKKLMSRGAERSQPKVEKSKIDLKKIPKDEYRHLVKDLTGQMELASANLEFEKAAELRDLISEIKSKI